jgi:hypothetical protein
VENLMTIRVASCAIHAVVVAVAVVTAGSALAQGTIQTLDRTNVFNRTNVLQTEFGDPARTVDFTLLNISPVVGFTTCQTTATRGIYCLDGRDVRNWPDPKLANGTGALVMSCADPALGLDLRKPDTCTAMTVDQSARNLARWQKEQRLRPHQDRPEESNNSCPEGSALTQSAFCARTYAAGRPLIADITPIDGDLGTTFNLGSGTLGLETAPRSSSTTTSRVRRRGSSPVAGRGGLAARKRC